MDGMETALTFARIQFAANITFHILFPTITIALGWVLLGFRLAFSATKNEDWMTAYFFWVKVFALTFAMGVVSGITMSFQFGTNWPGFMETVGNVAGPLLAYEVLTAFFLEAVFLGIMLFGYSRVPAWLHIGATALVALGTTASAFWIIVLNSWMHTPAGFEMIDGVAHATDWFAIVFNPSMPYRLAHVLLSSFLTVSFLLMGLSAYRRLRGERGSTVKLPLMTGLLMAVVLAPLQAFIGDMHGLNTLEHQPQKIAAMEANWQTQENVPLILFAMPDMEARENHFEIGVPGGASLILKHHLSGPKSVVPGLNDFVAEDGTPLHPPVGKVFYSFRIMVGTGLLMIAVSAFGVLLAWRGHLANPWFSRLLVAMSLSGWIATIAGWYTTEIGRQPWLVQGVLTTRDAVSDVPASLVGTTLAGYVLLYIALTIAYVWVLFFLARQAGVGGNTTPDPKADGFTAALAN